MSEQEKRKAIPVEGTVETEQPVENKTEESSSNETKATKPEKKGFFARIGDGIKHFAESTPVKTVVKVGGVIVGGVALLAGGIAIGKGMASKAQAAANETLSNLTGPDYEAVTDDETETVDTSDADPICDIDDPISC